MSEKLNGKKDNDLIWECSNCGFVLGRTTREREIIRVKHKDLYLRIGGGGWIESNCRRCGTLNQVGQISQVESVYEKKPFNPVLRHDFTKDHWKNEKLCKQNNRIEVEMGKNIKHILSSPVNNFDNGSGACGSLARDNDSEKKGGDK